MTTTATEISAKALAHLDLPGSPGSTRVVVAMSGGVDSSVTAALLRQAGYDVVGITLQLYDHGRAVCRPGSCCAGQDVHDARRVAAQFDIPHYVLDYEARFREAVIEEFADGYLGGETPVPCIRCNQRVKFKDLLETARELGAAALATGHYIRSRDAGPGAQGRIMLRAADRERDQSYFLFATTRPELDFLRFPLGELTKDETRRLARTLGLAISEKPDSQDICFVPEGRYSSVIERLRPGAGEPGEMVHLDGRVLGRHRGVLNYTVGQRRGLGVAAGEPLYVVALDAAARRVVVGPREALLECHLGLREVNWLGEGEVSEQAAGGLDLHVKIRSTHPPRPARLLWADGTLRVELEEGEYGVSPGQACVFYDGGGLDARVLGGGFIASTGSVRAPRIGAGKQVAPGGAMGHARDIPEPAKRKAARIA